MASFQWQRVALGASNSARVGAVAVAVVALGLVGCEKPPTTHPAAPPSAAVVSPAAPVAAPVPSPPAPETPQTAAADMHHTGAMHGGAEAHQAMMQAASGKPSGAPDGAAWPALARMDPRTPVPLQPMMAWHQKQNMMQHLVAIQQVSEALSIENWAAVEKAAKSIGYSDSMATMCRHMGAGAKGFTDLALTFHRRADTIAEAARKRDTKAVLKATAHTLKACTTCHATYRQDVVDAPTW